MRYLKNPADTRSEPALARLLRPVEVAASRESTSSPSAPASSDAAPADDVIDVAGVGKMLRIGRNTLYEMVARNEIPHRRFGRRIRFSRAAIMRWLDSWSLQGAKERQ
jgi:excisionase family DNA binding protein